MKTYLVTGGAGFIGSNYIHFLLNKYGSKVQIINLDKLTYAGNLENLEDIEGFPNYKFYHGDICDQELLVDIFSKHTIDYVVNFAAESHVDRSIMDASEFVRTNVLGVHTLLNVAKTAWIENDNIDTDKKFLQISTDEVYGALGLEGVFTESSPLNPRNPYSASKAGGDMQVMAFYETYGFPCNIVRCSNNFGPCQHDEKLIPLMIHHAICHQPLPIYGDGQQIRDWLYVEDTCRGIELVLRKGEIGEIYNIGGENEKTNLDLVKLIIETLSNLCDDEKINEDLIKFVKDRPGHDWRYALDISKMKKLFDWQPLGDFDERVGHTVEWYVRKHFPCTE